MEMLSFFLFIWYKGVIEKLSLMVSSWPILVTLKAPACDGSNAPGITYIRVFLLKLFILGKFKFALGIGKWVTDLELAKLKKVKDKNFKYLRISLLFR